MPCSCESHLDSIMKFLQDMRTEIELVKKDLRVVKTKSIRIENEILGTTPESELKAAEALMETTTVRHLVEKLAFDVAVLTEESNNRAVAEETRQREIQAAGEDLKTKFSEATVEKMKNLKLKYDVVAPKTFQTEFSDFLEEFRSQTLEALSQRDFSSLIIHGMVEEVARATDPNDLHKMHFSKKYEETGILIRQQYGKVFEVYCKDALNKTDDDFPETGLKVITEFLDEFKLCKESFASFQGELLNELQQINEQIEANRSLIIGLTKDYCEIGSKDCRLAVRQIFLNILRDDIIVSDPRLVQVFVAKLQQNMEEISNATSGS